MVGFKRLASGKSLVSVIALFGVILGGSIFTTSDAEAVKGHHRPGCRRDLKHRTPEQTIREHIALMQAGKIDEAMCDYAVDAKVVLPNMVVTGLNEIRGGLDGIGSLLGGAVPQVQTLTASGSVVLLTFSAFGTPCTIPDGSDTYIVERGQIVAQTVHDTLHSAPGYVCPVGGPVL